MKSFANVVAVLVLAVAGCASDSIGEGEDLDGDGKADGTQPGVSQDNLNGLWDGKLDGAVLDDAVIRSA
jgi:hypothetical protein